MVTAETNGKLWGWRVRDWVQLQEGQFRPLYEAVLARLALAPGQALLDVGCGAGLFASMAAERGLKVSGIDASEASLAIARERVPGGDFKLGDIEELAFPEGAFDGVTGINSFQYVADPVAALRSAKRAAKKGAHVIIVIPGKQEGMDAAPLVAALRPLMPSPGVSGPFELSDEATLRKLVENVGLVPVEAVDIDAPWTYPDVATAVRGVNSTGIAKCAIDHTSEEAVSKALEAVVAPFRQPDGRVRIGATFRCLVARA